MCARNFFDINLSTIAYVLKKFRPVLMYFVASVCVALIPFSALAIATHHLTPSEMGVIGQYQIAIAFVTALVGFGCISSVNIKIFELDLLGFRKYCFNIYLICLGSGVFLLAFVFLFGAVVADLFKFDLTVLYVAAFVGFVSFPIIISLGIYQSKGEVGKHSFIRIAQAVVEYGVFVVLVLFLFLGEEGRLIGAVCASVIISFYILYRSRREGFFVIAYCKEHMASAFSYGVPMLIHGLAGVLLTLGDRLVINVSLGADELGLYLVAAQITFSLNLIYDSVFKVMHPWVVKVTVAGGFRRAFASMACAFFALGLMGFAFYPIIYHFYGIIYSEEFSHGAELIFPLMLALVFRSGYYGFAIFINIFAKNKLLAYNTVFSGFLVIGSSFYLAGSFGVLGVAYAVVIGEAVSFILACLSSIYLHRHTEKGAQYDA